MLADTWQKSSYCGEGESCLHVASTETTVEMTESSDPAGVILRTTAPTWAALLHAIRTEETRV